MSDFLNLRKKFVVSDQTPQDTLLILGPVAVEYDIDFLAGTVTATLRYNPKQCGIITNIGKEK